MVALTFVQLISAARRYDPSRGRPDTFVLGITIDLIRDAQRRNARHRALVSRLAGRELLETDDLDRINAAIDAARSVDRLSQVLDGIPAGEQEMLRLVAAGQTPGQAADRPGISYPAGRARLSRARRRIRRQFTSLPEKENRT